MHRHAAFAVATGASLGSPVSAVTRKVQTNLGKYKVIYCDAPWLYDNEQDGDPARGAATYPKMSVEQLSEYAEGVQGIADKDCLLFMWATMPKLPQAIAIIEAWGFRFVTCAFDWVKMNKKARLCRMDSLCIPRFLKNGVRWVNQKLTTLVVVGGLYSGPGYWTNSNSELCLLAKRGHPKRARKDVKRLVLSPLRDHSRKPDEVRDRIVDLVGDVPRIELFARDRVDGWHAWGNEVECDIVLDRPAPGHL